MGFEGRVMNTVLGPKELRQNDSDIPTCTTHCVVLCYSLVLFKTKTVLQKSILWESEREKREKTHTHAYTHQCHTHKHTHKERQTQTQRSRHKNKSKFTS